MLRTSQEEKIYNKIDLITLKFSAKFTYLHRDFTKLKCKPTTSVQPEIIEYVTASFLIIDKERNFDAVMAKAASDQLCRLNFLDQKDQQQVQELEQKMNSMSLQIEAQQSEKDQKISFLHDVLTRNSRQVSELEEKYSPFKASFFRNLLSSQIELDTDLLVSTAKEKGNPLIRIIEEALKYTKSVPVVEKRTQLQLESVEQHAKPNIATASEDKMDLELKSAEMRIHNEKFQT